MLPAAILCCGLRLEDDGDSLMLDKLDYLNEKYGDWIPTVLMGGLFASPSPSYATLNLAAHFLPPWLLAVPGSSDLPGGGHHRIRESAFWSLVVTGRVAVLKPQTPTDCSSFRLWGHSPGRNAPRIAPEDRRGLALNVVVGGRSGGPEADCCWVPEEIGEGIWLVSDSGDLTIVKL